MKLLDLNHLLPVARLETRQSLIVESLFNLQDKLKRPHQQVVRLVVLADQAEVQAEVINDFPNTFNAFASPGSHPPLMN